MKQYKGAIFDLDGTLLDSMRVWDDIDVAFLKKRGLEVPPDYQGRLHRSAFWRLPATRSDGSAFRKRRKS